MEFSWNFLNRRSLGRTNQCWQSRSCVSVFNVMSSTPFRSGHLPDLLLVFSGVFLGAGCLPCHFPWSWMWRGGVHRGLSACVCRSSVFLLCRVACRHSLLSHSNETVRKHQELWDASLAWSMILGLHSRHFLLMGMQGKHFHSAEHMRERERERESPSLSWACSRGEQQEWGFPAVVHPLGFAA